MEKTIHGMGAKVFYEWARLSQISNPYRCAENLDTYLKENPDLVFLPDPVIFLQRLALGDRWTDFKPVCPQLLYSVTEFN